MNEKITRGPADEDDRVDRQAAALRLLSEVTRAAVEANSPPTAIAATLRILCERNAWQIGHAWRSAEGGADDLVSSGIWYAREGHDASRLREASDGIRIVPGVGFVGAVAARRTPMHVDTLEDFDEWTRGEAKKLDVRACMAFPVVVDDAVVAVLEFFHREPLSLEPYLMEVMADVGAQIGQAIERDRLERLISERTDRERGALARQLHDDLGQQLTALGMLATRLRRALESEGSLLAPSAARMVEAVDEAKIQVRGLTKGLLPIAVQSGTRLAHALRDLVEATEPAFSDVTIRFETDGDAELDDAFAATQLYRIAQEALYNAAKHAEARVVTIRLSAGNAGVELEVRDDGRGMPETLSRGSGSGLRIMRHRAGLIGSALEIRSAPGEGTAVRCRSYTRRGSPRKAPRRR